jgi:hypothetical protein
MLAEGLTNAGSLSPPLTVQVVGRRMSSNSHLGRRHIHISVDYVSAVGSMKEEYIRERQDGPRKVRGSRTQGFPVSALLQGPKFRFLTRYFLQAV